jgi:hypothetical protein
MIRAVWSRLLDGPSRLGWSAMPWTMRIGAWTSAIIGSGGLLVIPFAALNIGTYSVDNQRVSGRTSSSMGIWNGSRFSRFPLRLPMAIAPSGCGHEHFRSSSGWQSTATLRGKCSLEI